MIPLISLLSYARSAVLRTFPAEASSGKNAERLSSSGASKLPTWSWGPTVQ